MNAQALKDEGIDLERGTKAVDAILHPEPYNETKAHPEGYGKALTQPKPRATRSDKGTKRPAKVEATKTAVLTPEQAARLDSLVEGMNEARRELDRASRANVDATAAFYDYLTELQGK